jgi:hypothetical protein
MAQKRRGCDAHLLGLITQHPFLVFFRVLEACAHDITSEWSIQDETLEVLFARLLKCVKKSFLCTTFARGFLVETGRLEPVIEQDVSLEKHITHEPKKIRLL